jgi:hypothetical protein
VPSFPAVSPPDGFKVEASAQGVRMSWTCPPAPELQDASIQYKLRIYRREEGSQIDTKVAEAGLVNCHGPGVLDQNFEWEKTYEYRGATLIVVSVPGQPEIEIEGDDTPSAKIYVHDVFPPAVPSNLQAVFSAVGQTGFIDLVWSPDSDADIAGYNVYRQEPNRTPLKLNSELVKTPAYRDSTVQAGKKYLYSVSAVDVRGNESAKSEEAGETVP